MQVDETGGLTWFSYVALGLLADVNSLDELKPSSSPSSPLVENVGDVSAPPIHAKSGRILRDSEGKVIGVEIPEDDEPSKDAFVHDDTPWGAPMAGSDRQLAPVFAKTSVAIGMLSTCVSLPLGAWRSHFLFPIPSAFHRRWDSFIPFPAR